MMDKNNWFKTLKDGTSKQIILFPYAGGMSNAFNVLEKSDLFKSDFKIIMFNMPGHDLNKDKLYYDVEELCNRIAPMIENILTMPTILFGYSMGGAIVYELCNKLESLKFIEKVVIAAANPPKVTSRECAEIDVIEQQVKKNISSLLLRADLNGDQTEIFESMYDYLFPIFCADVHLYYSASDRNKIINVKAQILFGEEDPKVNRDTVSYWNDYFYEMEVVKFHGGHMFLNDAVNTENLSKIITG
ncbi:hypothetical protein CN281_11270 [Bacillus cereus]|nr:hypothetical protein CN281_11270 [Bacillus cereus]PFH95731.1 hypothetical protein COI78_08590 [Bacillus cereus]